MLLRKDIGLPSIESKVGSPELLKGEARKPKSRVRAALLDVRSGGKG